MLQDPVNVAYTAPVSMALYLTHYSWIGSLSNARAERETDGTSKPDTDEEEDEEVLQHQQDVRASVRTGK